MCPLLLLRFVGQIGRRASIWLNWEKNVVMQRICQILRHALKV